MNPSNDMVVLDGMYPDTSWPIEAAKRLVTDEKPWSSEVGENDQSELFAYVASFVAGRNRYKDRVSTIIRLLLSDFPLDSLSTQQLLDMLNLIWRAQHHVGGSLDKIESRLRQLLNIVILRIESTNPPLFIKIEPTQRDC